MQPPTIAEIKLETTNKRRNDHTAPLATDEMTEIEKIETSLRKKQKAAAVWFVKSFPLLIVPNDTCAIATSIMSFRWLTVSDV